MKNFKNSDVNLLSKQECCQINGGKAAEGSYDLGYSIGSAIRRFLASFADAGDVLGAPRPIGMY